MYEYIIINELIKEIYIYIEKCLQIHAFEKKFLPNTIEIL